MKDKILSAIKVAIGKTNINDRTLNAYVGIIADKITDESQIDEAIKPYVEVLKEFQGNMNSEIATQVAAVKNAQPPVNTPPTTSSAENPNDAILAELKKISERQDKIEQANLASQKQAQRTQLLESIKKTALTKDAANEKSGWATNAGLLTNALALITIEDTDTEESISKKCQEKYNAMATDIFGKSDAVPGIGGGSGANEKEVKEQSEQKIAEILGVKLEN